MKPRVGQRINQLCANEEVTKKVHTRKLKEMFISAALDSLGISNHSLRATSVSRMDNEGVPEKLLTERSGHLSRAGVRLYERTSSLQQKQFQILCHQFHLGWTTREEFSCLYNRQVCH